MGFSQGLSGLNATQRNLTTIGNNIANSQTVGYKGGRTEFADMFAGSIGLGTKVSEVSRDYSGGSITTTGRDMDLAINGGGFFRLSQQDQVVYSRNGQFHRTKEGFLSNAQGALLTGYNVEHFNDPNQDPVINASGSPGTIELPTDSLNAKATTEGSLVMNLDSGEDSVTVTPFDADDIDSYNWSTPYTVYDSLGNAHNVNLYFSKTAANKWEMNGEVVVGGTPKAVTGTPANLEFDVNGNLTTPASPASVTLGFTPTNGSDAVSVDLNLTGSTQTALDSEATSILQNGHAPGKLVSVAVDDDGMVRGSYSNGETVNLAQLAMARFPSNHGLEPAGDNAYRETGESGQPILGLAGEGQFGALRGRALEESNVDLSEELVHMIIAQRTYQANAQTIQTQSQVLQTAVNLAR